jgi:hypothetical protein
VHIRSINQLFRPQMEWLKERELLWFVRTVFFCLWPLINSVVLLVGLLLGFFAPHAMPAIDTVTWQTFWFSVIPIEVIRAVVFTPAILVFSIGTPIIFVAFLITMGFTLKRPSPLWAKGLVVLLLPLSGWFFYVKWLKYMWPNCCA